MNSYLTKYKTAPDIFDWVHGDNVSYMTNCIDTTLATVKLDLYDKWHVEINVGGKFYRWPKTFETDLEALSHADELVRLLRSALPFLPDRPREEPNWNWDN